MKEVRPGGGSSSEEHHLPEFHQTWKKRKNHRSCRPATEKKKGSQRRRRIWSTGEGGKRRKKRGRCGFEDLRHRGGEKTNLAKRKEPKKGPRNGHRPALLQDSPGKGRTGKEEGGKKHQVSVVNSTKKRKEKGKTAVLQEPPLRCPSQPDMKEGYAKGKHQ